MKYFHIPCPRVINVDDNPSNQKVVAELKRERKLGRRYRCRACPYLNNIVEQDHPSDQKPAPMRAKGFVRSMERGRRFKATRSCISFENVAGQILLIHEPLGLKVAVAMPFISEICIRDPENCS